MVGLQRLTDFVLAEPMQGLVAVFCPIANAETLYIHAIS